MRILTLFAVALCLLNAGCGIVCYGTRNLVLQPLSALDQFAASRRDDDLARAAWEEFKQENRTMTYSPAFSHGFIDGYADYLDAGGNGEPPPAPPPCYRSIRYQTPEGQQAIQDWFDGFRQGAATARQSGWREQVVLPLAAPLDADPAQRLSGDAPGTGPVSPASPDSAQSPVRPPDELPPPRIKPRGEGPHGAAVPPATPLPTPRPSDAVPADPQ